MITDLSHTEQPQDARDHKSLGHHYNLLTCHNTIVYIDPELKQLRHGPRETAPLNLALHLVDGKGSLVVVSGQLVGTRVGFSQNGSEVALDGENPEHSVCCVDILPDGRVGIRFGDTYISADWDGVVRNDRKHCLAWEQYHLLAADEPWPVSQRSPNSSASASANPLRSFEYYLTKLGETRSEVFFLQIGAADGRSFDALYPFASRYNWPGLLIEPLPDLFEELRKNYGHCGGIIFENVAIADSFEWKNMKRVPLDVVRTGKVPSWALGISSFYSNRNAIGGQRVEPNQFEMIEKYTIDICVACVPLSHLLEKHSVGRIDVVQIDTEGHDYHILRQLDFTSLLPAVIHFECCNLPDAELQAALHLLEIQGYNCANDGFNVLAVQESRFRVEENAHRHQPQPDRLKIGFYTSPKWAFGTIHAELMDRLHDFNIESEILDFEKAYIIPEFQSMLQNFDFIVTNPQSSLALTKSYRFPPARIALVSHGEPELIAMCEAASRNVFDSFLDFAVVSESLYASALTLGIRPPSAVLSIGVNYDKFFSEPARELRKVGYAATYSRSNYYGVEIKRGELARMCVTNSGLEFVTASEIALSEMPDFYRSVDSILMPSLQEGAGLPALEGAAAGRLVIGTPTGHFPRCAYEGAGILAPLLGDQFVEFTTRTLVHYKSDAGLFQAKCKAIQSASRKFNWSYFVPAWADFLWKASRKLARISHTR